ncbi:MAG TPA: glycosyltransferase, partial [Pyrinomonadaceae bacterium]|nr:glycosyltransferase [Pyrinomonadaceae bacterium]
MAKIVLATFGSLGDLHPKIALGLELRERGHDVTIAAMEFYRERIGQTGLEFAPLAPHLDPENKELAIELMHSLRGPERIIKDIIFGNIRAQYDDLTAAIDGKDLLVTGEVVYAVTSVVEKTGIKWISTSLQPTTFFSVYDPIVPPAAPWIEKFRPLGPNFFRVFYRIMRLMAAHWYTPYKKFRRDLGLSDDHDPIFDEKYSPLLHLALFSKVLAKPQPDWPHNTIQTGFCFYDGKNDTGKMPDGLAEFLDSGEPPIVFTLGSAAVMDPRDFFEQSIAGAKTLGRRAVLLYGIFNEPPKGLTDDIVG